MKVLGIGESVIDKAQIIGQNQTTQHVGGPVPIALMLLARLDVDCTLITTLGQDTEAAIIEETLTSEKISLKIHRQKHTKINTYLINPENGARQKVRGSTKHADIEKLDAAFLATFDVIIIDRHEQKAFYEVIKKKKPTTKIIIDPSTEVSSFTLDMIKYADYPIIPIEALRKIGNGKDIYSSLQRLHAITQKTAIITAGELGSIIHDGILPDIVPAIRVQAIDVQGAGDVYRGAFAYGVLKNWSLTKSASFANLVAGLQCKKLGNASALPTKEEIKKYQQQLVQNKLAEMETHLGKEIEQYEQK